ncbi:PfkB family carbohydrate kinase [Nonomuraea sp. NPDC050310]|uniref:PfkB family carbohydrate kinase n=1 Tax=Nonomuraea sp. NPDC050310 TaxID=3154935 RepID=UPI0033DB0B05
MKRGPLVVVGDCLLDVDVEGEAARLAPDAPVPVVEGTSEQLRPGGAGLAALLAARDDDEVILVTALGDDDAGRTLHSLLAGRVEVVRVPMRGTTVRKTRVRARGQTLVRIDTGDGRAAGADPARAALRDGPVAAVLRRAGAVLVSDYGRGVAEAARELLAGLDVPVVWDPHPRGALPVPGCALVTPSEAEARVLCREPYTGPDQAARHLTDLLRARAVAVTMGAQGASLACADGHHTRVPPPALGSGQDACGAGDRLASAAALALRAGRSAEEAVAAGVAEASRFVAEGGAAAIRLKRAEMGDRPRTAIEVAELVRASGRQLIATGGCFDLLHAGHVSLLRRARALGDALIVCVNSDESVRRLKGPGRPLVGQRDRVEVLRALGCVDAVLVFEEDTPEAVIEQVRPHVWVKGGDYSERRLPEQEVLDRIGAEAVVLSSVPGRSTTNLIAAAQKER